MFQRWKLILTNWINCYFKTSEDEQNLNIDSLVTIISHLRENLNLDESKSAILEAQTVEEFLREKYPEFKFGNGTVKASNDKEICLSASLLLFFVCVNSKNFDIKNAMCSKLIAEDQETILKFSKCLMECPVITLGGVQAAITEACGQDIAAMEAQSTIAETPPAVRSYHSNVRRLHAELEAERFDRNYLQEELSRTNNKLERLLKEKEQHKSEILNLKAKISLCCGDEAVSKNAEAAADVSAKLMRQLQQLEVRLEEMQAQLDDVAYERDTYKAKIDELKNDRDKWLVLSQQENARVSQLSEELETERRHNQSLKDLVTELRQHNKLNGMDCSVECDDHDTSIHSLQHNSSICSEVCVNVVEVQLGEERAKIVVLQQQIQNLLVQISELNQIREADKTSLKNVIAQRENDICNLKHRINEEIEKKNNLKAHCDNEKTKLNNEINELEQRLKESQEYSNAVIEKKMEEIQTLQEEKLSLLHSLNNETTKLQNIIKDLQCELNSEKQSRSRMKEGYENHIMKLNEKVLNRNNELVELQNCIFEKGEQVEKMQIELRNEKEAYSKLITQYEDLNEQANIMQTDFKKQKQGYMELVTQHHQLNDEKNALQIEVEKEKEVIEELLTKNHNLDEEKDTVKKQVTEEQKALKDLTNKYQEINAQNNIMQTDLTRVKEAGKKLQNKYHSLHDHQKELKIELVKEKNMFDELNNKYKNVIQENNTMQIELVKNKEAFEVINHKYEDVKELKNTIKNELEQAKAMVNEFVNKCLHLEKENNTIQSGLQKVNMAFEELNNEYKKIVEQNNTTQIKLKKENYALKELSDKYQKLEEENNKIESELQREKDASEILTSKYQESVKQNNSMETELKKQKVTFAELLHEYRNLDEHRNTIENDLRQKQDEEQNLKLDLENKVYSLKEKLTESETLADKLKKSYECQIENLNIMVTKLTNNLKEKTVELETLRRDKDTLQQTVVDSCKAIKKLQEELKTEKQNIEKLTSDFESERQVLKNMVTVTESVMEDTKVGLNNEIAEHLKAKHSFEVEKSSLQTLLKDLEIKYQAVDIANASLLSLLKLEKKGKEDVEKESELVRDYLDQVITCLSEERKTNANVIQDLESQNQFLTEHNEKLKKDLNELNVVAKSLADELKSRAEKFEILLSEKSQLEESLQKTANNYATVQLDAQVLEGKIADINDENKNLKLKESESFAKIEELKVAMGALETELRTRGDKFNIVLEGKTLAESELLILSDKLNNAMEEKSQVQNNLNDAQLEINELKNKIELKNNNLRSEENESFAKINELEDAMSALKNELRNKLEIISQEKSQQDNELETVTDQLKTTLKEKTQVESNLQEQTQKLTAVQLENKELEKRITALYDENNNLKLENSETATKLEECKVKEIEFEKNLNELNVAANTLENELKSRTEKFEILLSEKSQLEESLKKTANNYATVQLDVQVLEGKIADITDENKNLKLKESESYAKIEELKVAMGALETELRTRGDKFNTVLEGKTLAESELLILSEKLNNAMEEKSQLQNNLQYKIQNLNDAQLEINELKNKIVVLTDENNSVRLEENESFAKINELKDAVSALENELRNKLEIISQEKSQQDKQLETLTDQLKTTLKEKTQVESNLQEQIQKLTAVQLENKELESRITALYDENNNLKLEKNETATKLEECKVKEIEFEKNLEVSQYLINNFKVAIKTAESELASQKDKMSKTLEEVTQNLVDKNNNLKKEKDEVLIKLEAKVEDLKVVQKENEMLKTTLNVLENEIKDKEDTLKTVLEEKSKVENNLQTHVGYLAEALEKKSQVEKTLEETTQNLSVVQHDITELNNEITALLGEKNNLELEKKKCSATIEELQSKIEDLEAVQDVNQELRVTISALENDLHTRADELQTISLEKSEIENALQTQKDQFAKLSEEKSQVEKALEEKTAQEKTHSTMITKLTNYVKEKTVELEALRKDKDILQQTVGDSCKVIKSLEDNIKAEKQNIDKLTSDFESERQLLKNMVTATESVMEDTKLGLVNEISQHKLAKTCLEVEKKELHNIIRDLEMKHQALEMANGSLLSLLKLEREGKQDVENESETVRDYLDEVIGYLGKERNTNTSVISALEFQEKALVGDYEKMKTEVEVIKTTNHDLKVAKKTLENELQNRDDKLHKVLEEKSQMEKELKMHADQIAKVLEAKSQIEEVLNEKMQNLIVVQLEIKELKSKMVDLFSEKNNLELEQRESCAKIEEFKAIIDSSQLKEKEELSKLKSENQQLLTTIEENRTVITNLEQLIKHELGENHKLRDENEQEKLVMANKMSLLQDYHTKAEKVLEERQNEIVMLQNKLELSEQDSKAKDGLISKMSKEKDAVISTISKELVEEKALREKLEKELQTQKSIASELRNDMEIRALKKENEQLIRAIGQQETFTALCQEKATGNYACHQDPRDIHQVDSSSSDNTHSSVESLKTITDLERIIHDKNRTITTLQTDITYLKSLIAESETKLLDVTKELEVSKDNVQQLSSQLKKIVNQKNEEIADLKKQVTKMSATENRATEIIKVSAKYQAMILKRVAEIKSNTVLKELTNFGNSENEVRRSLAGSITMEDLENFLETTDRHLKRCSEKQIALQKERDRLTEVNRIHESEIINLKKFLTELSVSFQTFSSVKDLYGHKLSRVISVQRTVRREILNLDGRITDATMCKLERGYGAVMQDLAECTMNLERWVERCISRTVSVEKIKQAFTSDTERSSLASPSFQNTGLEIQLEELEKSFQKLLEEIARAVKSEGSMETQAATVMEVRAEYEDKLNRMKAKMKELFNEQMTLLKNKQREDIELLERELQKTRSRMEDSKRAYESHIKKLTMELWSVGEKYLVKNDEAEWLKRKQRSGSLMSLQHVHSSGLVPSLEPSSRPSDAQSLRSLPNTDHIPKGKQGRGLHMSDEEGEVFDNRCLKELAMTPRREPPGQRLSELKWRNSLCPPHLKSSYPAETQFATTLDEEDLKAGASAAGARGPRKEVGITAYKKPGPPTPSKQAGRLSATDSELRESVRVENEPHGHAERKTSTPARFRAFLRLSKHETNEGTPRTRRLSSIFRKK